MNEEIEYAEMLEIPVSTVNVVRKNRRRKKQTAEPAVELKDTAIASVNDRLSAPETPVEESPASERVDEKEEGNLLFDPVPDRIDTVRLYDTGGKGKGLYPQEYALNDGGRYEMKKFSPKGVRVALGIEFGLACALCCGIFLTNVFMPTSAINTFFRALATPTEPAATPRPYTDFTLTPVVSELSDAKLDLSPTGILSFTDECCVYPAADGKVSEVTQDSNGLYTLKISHSDAFTGVITGLDQVYYSLGQEVKSHVPVGYSEGETEVQVTMYADGQLLNCFELTEENCLAWSANAQ